MREFHGKHVVVVEDEELIAQAIQTDLERVGCSVKRFRDGQAALNDLLEHAPDLVILDLKLPSLHGYEVCKRLRRHYDSWTMPILMLTALEEPLNKLRGFACGADAYLTKPYEPSELLSTLELLCHGSGDAPSLPAY